MDNLPESYICEDMAFEVLSWMPAKSVIRNSPLVSKSLIHDPQFVRYQSINSSHCDGGFFIQTDIHTNLDFGVLPTESPNTFGIPKDSLAFLKKKARVMASTQGLILIRKVEGEEDEFSICNPVTRAFVPIPPPKNIENLRRFGNAGFVVTCDPRNTNDFPNDFTVVAPLFVEVDDGAWNTNDRLAVYRNGKWDDDTCDLKVPPCRQLRMEVPVGAFSGPNMGLVVHYLCESLPHEDRNPVYPEPYMVAYDMEAKRLWRTMKLPSGAWVEDFDHTKLRMLKWGRSEVIGLVRIDRRRVTVWKLESYKPEGWRRVVDETLTEMGVAEEEGELVGCSVVNDDGLLFATWKQVYLYEMEGINTGRLEFVGSHGYPDLEVGFRKLDFTLYANTLRPVCGHEISFLKT